MKTTYIFSLLLCFTSILSAQSIFGKWMILDENGVETSIVSIYHDTDIVYANIVDVLDVEGRKAICTKCPGESLNQPIVGLMIIKDLEFDGNYYRGGTILDPKTGETFKCRLSITEEKPNTLEVRSYRAFDYKTQYWKRMML